MNQVGCQALLVPQRIGGNLVSDQAQCSQLKTCSLTDGAMRMLDPQNKEMTKRVNANDAIGTHSCIFWRTCQN